MSVAPSCSGVKLLSPTSVVPDARDNGPTCATSPETRVSFRQAYGALGIPLLLVAVLCILWTSRLIFLTLAPNEAANRLMRTGDYDYGQFWLIVEREPLIKWASVLGFALVDVGYMAVLVKMFMFRSSARRENTKETPKSWYVALAERFKLQQVVMVWVDLTGYSSKHRKYFVSIFLSRSRVRLHVLSGLLFSLS